MATVDSLLTAEQYALLPDMGRPTELVRGRIVAMNPPTPWHGYVCSRIVRIVGGFADEHDFGRVMCNDSGVVTERRPDTVRGADVCYYSYQRLPKGKLPRGYLDVLPELVFEVRSQYDSWTEMLRKAAEYLNAGVTVVCLVDPDRQRVMVCEKDDMPRILGKDDMLALPLVLPGFEVGVSQLFE
jgi:Uma2 family endonuclease